MHPGSAAAGETIVEKVEITALPWRRSLSEARPFDVFFLPFTDSPGRVPEGPPIFWKPREDHRWPFFGHFGPFLGPFGAIPLRNDPKMARNGQKMGQGWPENSPQNGPKKIPNLGSFWGHFGGVWGGIFWPSLAHFLARGLGFYGVTRVYLSLRIHSCCRWDR